MQHLVFGFHLLPQVFLTDLLDFNLGLELDHLGIEGPVFFFQVKYVLLVALDICLLHRHVVLLELFFSLAQHQFSLTLLKVLLGVLFSLRWGGDCRRCC